MLSSPESQVRTVCRTIILAHTRPGTLEILFSRLPGPPSYAKSFIFREREMILARRLCAFCFALLLTGCEVGTESTGQQAAVDSRQTADATDDVWTSAGSRIARG